MDWLYVDVAKNDTAFFLILELVGDESKIHPWFMWWDCVGRSLLDKRLDSGSGLNSA